MMTTRNEFFILVQVANSNVATHKPDYLGIMVIVFTFFIVFFEFVLLETLGTPVSMDQFGWSAERTIVIVGTAMIISSIVSTSLFFLIPIGAKYFDERVLLIGFGVVPYTLGRIFFFPYSSEVAPMRRLGCLHSNGTELVGLNEEQCNANDDVHWKVVQHGCPEAQTWCFELPALTPVTVAIGYAICTLGFPCCMVLCQTIFSKMLGPRPQGVWMGALTSISSLARVVGPIFVTYIYTEYGTIATSGTAVGLMVLVLVILLLIYKRLVPLGKRKS
ncbi:Major facilitator superfamily domain-containing protein 8 [Folsomia candida]|uniref:Major facilitator superfamily domain-containing protein 8 n=1 Tax=Folsomia candida TaxID=158441 RepID=A0A226E3V4_FOLCA|nr:Major facilitator superfamily domain-containing protein 8 [Folsomia candida]